MTETATILPAPLTYDDAVTLAKAVVAEFGIDYVDLLSDPDGGAEVCMYVDHGKPSCIVAQILHRHGVPLSELAKWEGLNGSDMGPKGVNTINGYDRRRSPTAPLVADNRTAQFLGYLQQVQDGGGTWGRALLWAIDTTPAA